MLDKQGLANVYNFIADYQDGSGQRYNRCFQAVAACDQSEKEAAEAIQAALTEEGMEVYSLICIRERLTMDELQQIADHGALARIKQGHICFYAGKRCREDMRDAFRG